MSIDIKQLEKNINLHSLQPTFLNLELHHVIALDENTFRFADWNETPGKNEQKFYCFLVDKELLIPAGNVALKKSYILKNEPAYPVLESYKDFVSIIKSLPKKSVAKCVRNFSAEDIDTIKKELGEKYETVEKHIVKSPEGEHIILKVNDIDISISKTMVYFRYRNPFISSPMD